MLFIGLHLEVCYKVSHVLKVGYIRLGTLPNAFNVLGNAYG